MDDVLDMEFLPKEKENYRLVPGDVLLSEASGSPDQVGKPMVWHGELEECCFQNTVIRLRPVEIASAFLLVVFRHLYFNKIFAKIAAGVGINHLSAAKFSRIAVPIPPLDEQQAIVAEVEAGLVAVTEGARSVHAAMRRASRLRQAVLHRAFEGKLVAQDAADEPASALLARIQAEKQAEAVTERTGRPRLKVPKEIILRRGAVVCYTIKRLEKSASFGRTQLGKTLYVAQTDQAVDLQFNFARYAAGPFDEAIFKLEGIAKKRKDARRPAALGGGREKLPMANACLYQAAKGLLGGAGLAQPTTTHLHFARRYPTRDLEPSVT